MHVSQLDVVKLLGQLLEEAYPNFVEKNLSYDCLLYTSRCV